MLAPKFLGNKWEILNNRVLLEDVIVSEREGSRVILITNIK